MNVSAKFDNRRYDLLSRNIATPPPARIVSPTPTLTRSNFFSIHTILEKIKSSLQNYFRVIWSLMRLCQDSRLIIFYNKLSVPTYIPT